MAAEQDNTENKKQEESTGRDWRQLVKDYDESGLNVKEFSEERGIKYHTMKWWLRKRAQETNKSSESNNFVELSILEVQTEYGIRFSNGRELYLKGSYSVARVKQLMELVEASDD